MKTYLNGLGHLIVTLAVLGMCTFLLYTNKLDQAVIAGILGSVISFWFLSGAKSQAQADNNSRPLTPVQP
jgi:uncharacterized MnhB-related membrane protein